jgi:hypothetical protein
LRIKQLSTAMACVVLATTCGCGRDADLAEAEFTSQYEGVRARVWVPLNEPRSVGTYRAEVTWPGGTSDLIRGERDGMIGNVWLTDLGEDGTLELVVAMSSVGSGTYGSVDIYEHRGGAFRRVVVRSLDESRRAGYMGHDSFYVEGGRLYRSFPVYAEHDPNAAPTGGEAVLWYSLPESTWVSAPGGREDAE